MSTVLFSFALSYWIVAYALPDSWQSLLKLHIDHFVWWLFHGRKLKVNASERRARELFYTLRREFRSVCIQERVELSPYTRAAVCEVDGFVFCIGMNDFSPKYILILSNDALRDPNRFRAHFEFAKKLDLLPSDPHAVFLSELPGKIREAMLLEKI